MLDTERPSGYLLITLPGISVEGSFLETAPLSPLSSLKARRGGLASCDLVGGEVHTGEQGSAPQVDTGLKAGQLPEDHWSTGLLPALAHPGLRDTDSQQGELHSLLIPFTLLLIA